MLASHLTPPAHRWLRTAGCAPLAAHRWLHTARYMLANVIDPDWPQPKQALEMLKGLQARAPGCVGFDI